MEGAPVVEAADEVRWWPDGEWFAVVAVIHVLLAAPWVAWFGWPAVVMAGLSLAWHGRALAGREVWRFRFVDDRVVILAPESTPETPVPVAVASPLWMTDRLVVVRTRRRIIPMRAGRLTPEAFARLRRALLAGARPRGRR
ncbi:MAG: hypothetical protein F4Y01_09565 [Gammaproteobacteria bacterium]|nr:hypothetical protein [Gammaproteobacteria bacterium]